MNQRCCATHERSLADCGSEASAAKHGTEQESRDCDILRASCSPTMRCGRVWRQACESQIHAPVQALRLLRLLRRPKRVNHAVHRSQIEQVPRDAYAANGLSGKIVRPCERAVAFTVCVEMPIVTRKNFVVPDIGPRRVPSCVWLAGRNAGLNRPLDATGAEIQRHEFFRFLRAQVVDGEEMVAADRSVSPRLAGQMCRGNYSAIFHSELI
jgi:hypothetical protein